MCYAVQGYGQEPQRGVVRWAGSKWVGRKPQEGAGEWEVGAGAGVYQFVLELLNSPKQFGTSETGVFLIEVIRAKPNLAWFRSL